jgi:hypothetical protein
MVDFIGAARDPQFRQDVGQGLVDAFGRGLSMVGGAPVDLTTMFLRPLGYSVPDEQIVGSSEYIGRQMANLGLISEARNPAAEFLSALLIPDPTDIQKLAPVIERGIAKAAQNISAPRTLNPQAGQIGVSPPRPQASENIDDGMPRLFDLLAAEASSTIRQAPREEALRIAQENAAKPVSEGGLDLPPWNTAIDRARAMGFDTPMYHATGADISEFIPSEYRKASFFASTPESATAGRRGGLADRTATGKAENIMPVMIRSERIVGLNFTPKEKEVLSEYQGLLSESQVKNAMKKMNNDRWYEYFDEIKLPNGDFVYKVKSPTTYKQAKTTGLDVYGSQFSDYVSASHERFASEKAKESGMKGYLQYDEGGLSMAVTDPSQIRSRFAAFDPARRYESDLLGSVDPRLLAILGPATAAAVYGLGELYANQRRDEQTR